MKNVVLSIIATTLFVSAQAAGEMKIKIASVFVTNQDKALAFYTEKLGFVKKDDVPLGEARWLTVVSASDPEGAELLLEPNSHPAAKKFQQAIYAEGIPKTTFEVKDVAAEYQRLKNLGVVFRQEPVQAGGTTIAIFEDTVGNLIQMHQKP